MAVRQSADVGVVRGRLMKLVVVLGWSLFALGKRSRDLGMVASRASVLPPAGSAANGQ